MAPRLCGSSTPSSITRRFDAGVIVELGIAGSRPESHHALMRFDAGEAIKRGALFETNGSPGGAREVDQFLEPRASGALCDQMRRADVLRAKPQQPDECRRESPKVRLSRGRQPVFDSDREAIIEPVGEIGERDHECQLDQLIAGKSCCRASRVSPSGRAGVE